MLYLIVGAIIISLLVVAIFIYCGMVVAAKDDDEIHKMLQEMYIKDKKVRKK